MSAIHVTERTVSDLFGGALEESVSEKRKPGTPKSSRKKKTDAPAPAKGQSRFGDRSFVTETSKSEPVQVNSAEFGGSEQEDNNDKPVQVKPAHFLVGIPKEPPLDNDAGRLARVIDMFKLLDMIETE
ncbi:hypothetical protein AVT65_gp71 [Gordonia phage Gmala1]|uniref:Uncharacterized protein n=1 Tax=Gordonia phage Gmala1 TaxID=1622190 RepID=A0A0E3T6N6_9CAUD|nr:hypothetical protein AVT65_gp71 [Gordonia phage Gmala1]AKC02909.1 hypothetical protein Gmala1_71 [Gordonia phage Gmala1]